MLDYLSTASQPKGQGPTIRPLNQSFEWKADNLKQFVIPSNCLLVCGGNFFRVHSLLASIFFSKARAIVLAALSLIFHWLFP